MDMVTTIFVGGLMIEGGKVLLKREAGPEGREHYVLPGKLLEGDETLEMAASTGFKADTRWNCAVSDLAYVIETFRGAERELGLYFMVNVPSSIDRRRLAPGCTFLPLEEAIGLDVRPAVLAGKVFADERRGHRGSATYLVSYVDG